MAPGLTYWLIIDINVLYDRFGISL